MIDYKISIIVPIYNTEKFLPKCIESMINQKHRNLEIILVNDGSTDKSLDICKYYASKDSRIIIINKENGGVSSARNKGLEMATGDYIGFVDSDDYVTKDMYEKLLLSILENGADIAECGYYTIDPNAKILNKYTLESEIITGKYECVYSYLIKNNTTNFNCNKLYKSNIFDNLRYSNYRYSEDYIVNVKAFSKCDKKVTIGDSCYYYVLHGESACNRQFDESRFDIIEASQEVLDYIDGIYPKLSKFVIVYILNYIRKLYVDLMESKLSNKTKYKKFLVNKYEKYFLIVRQELKSLVKHRKTYMALWIFSREPYIYYMIEKYRKKLNIPGILKG